MGNLNSCMNLPPMDASILSSHSNISSAMHDLEFLEDRFIPFFLAVQKGNLMFLRTFLLCARKWGKHGDPSLAALLFRIERLISKSTRKIHSYRPPPNKKSGRSLIFDWTDCYIYAETRSFKKKINQWYVIFSDLSSRQSSDFIPVNKDELIWEIFDSLLENLLALGHWQRENVEVVKYTKVLAEKLRLLKNLIHFITLHEVEVEDGKLGLLFTHTEGAAVNVARRISFSGFMKREKVPMLIKNADYCELPQSIVPVETCKALIASNCLSRKSRREADAHVLKDSVDLLLHSLFDILKSGTYLVINIRDRLQKLYEGLRSLRIILKMKSNKFDDRMIDLSGDVVYDAGLAIFSLSLNAVNDDLVEELVSLDLLEKFKVIQAMVAEEFPERSSFNFPRTNELGFVDFLLNYMMDLTSPESASPALANYPVQSIQQEISSLRPFLGKIEQLQKEDKELQSLWDRVMEVAYKVEFLIDSLLVGYLLHSSSMSFHSILEEIKVIKAEALNFDSKRFNLKVNGVTKKFYHVPSQRSKPMINNLVVGLEDEARSVINRLTRGSDHVRIVLIVGMAGLGKTTLAEKVYNDAAVINHFHARAWCTVSQVLDKKNLFLEILSSIDSKFGKKFSSMSEEDLAHQVKRRLLRNKYLIVLDDVWDIVVWNGLEASFPDDGNGSRVILTSRHRDVAPQDKLDQDPLSLHELDHDESWNLLKEKFGAGKDILPPELFELRKEMLELCHGLPLTIVTLAGILANMDQSGWKDVVRSLRSSGISSSEKCAAALQLSYRHLPNNLKPCFLYFGGFPEDHEHTIKRLTWLWVAEGFVPTTHSKSAEDVANDYMMDLIDRSLVMVSKQRSIGGVKTCRIHDLLHEFCVTKAKEEQFLQFISGYGELHTSYVPNNLRRLCVNCKQRHFEESKLSFPTVRSLLYFQLGRGDRYTWFDLSSIFQVFKLLRVLDLSQINVGGTFPKEIELLIQLRYLAVLCEMIKSIPASIAILSNLETLILEVSGIWDRWISVPDTMWNMKKLRHVQLKEGRFYFPTQNLENSSELCNLDTWSSDFLSWSDMDYVVNKFPNIRKLKCNLFVSSAENGSKKIVLLDSLSQLKSLNLSLRSDFRYQYEFHFPLNIEKLTLTDHFQLPWSQIPVVANLPNLKVLKLRNDAFVGEEWSIEEEEFPKLEFLQLAYLDIVKWTASDCESSFPCLKKLVLIGCENLVEIPSSLGNVSSLEMIKQFRCPNCASSLEKIKEEQIDSMGYTDLKIISSS